MTNIFYYNVIDYINSAVGVEPMTIDGILADYKPCKKYALNSTVSTYMEYVENKPF